MPFLLRPHRYLFPRTMLRFSLSEERGLRLVGSEGASAASCATPGNDRKHDERLPSQSSERRIDNSTALAADRTTVGCGGGALVEYLVVQTSPFSYCSFASKHAWNSLISEQNKTQKKGVGTRVRVVPRMWMAGSAGLKRRLGPPLRGVCAAVRWYSATPTSDVGEPSTVNALHRQPDMLSRYEPRLIRNFRYALLQHRHRARARVQQSGIVKYSTVVVLYVCLHSLYDSCSSLEEIRREPCTAAGVYGVPNARTYNNMQYCSISTSTLRAVDKVHWHLIEAGLPSCVTCTLTMRLWAIAASCACKC